MPYGDQALFLRAKSFRRLGGFAEIPLMEDVDLVARAGAIGSIRTLPEAVLTSGRRWECAGVLRMTGINLASLVGSRLGVPPGRLAAWRRRPFAAPAAARPVGAGGSCPRLPPVLGTKIAGMSHRDSPATSLLEKETPEVMTTPTSEAAAVPSEEAVRRRYSAGAREAEAALCCPVSYDPRYLEAIPTEVRERDYGCGDPTPYVRPGETVLDLGSGGGKVCFIAAQIVGPGGRVIGVDCNREMLALARRHRPAVAGRLGYDNIEFRCGLIQDLRLDLDGLAAELSRQPVHDQWDWLALRSVEDRLRREHPLIPDESVDCILSNCVLNLVRPTDRAQLFDEMFRVLGRQGRVAVSDIVADEDVPEHQKSDAQLWSGCIAGAYREDAFLRAFEEAGFHGIEVVKRQREPWRTVEGIEFRSVTVVAHKGKQGPCLERNQALVYRGPFKKVEDDDGHVFPRGERIAVCDKTFHLLQREPYGGSFEPIEPREPIRLDEARPFDCRRSARRHPRETKGTDYAATTDQTGSCCGPDGACC